MLPQATIITVVETKDGSSPPPSSGLDLLFAAAAHRQHPKTPGRAVTDCASDISSLSSEVDLTRARAPPPSKIFFPEVLMDMLNNNQRFASIISWKPDGKSFVIKSRHEFKDKVLPMYFQSNFDSFLRKLKRWGFEKDNVRRRGDPSIEFSHRYFRRDKSGLCLRMRCKSGPGRMTDDSCNIQEDPQEVERSSSSPGHDDGTRQKVDELVDHLMNQQTTQKLLLEETNRGAALDDTLAALTAAAGRRDHTYSYNQAPISEQLRHMSEAQLLMKVKKRMIVAAKKAQLACKLSEYMASPHHQQERERTIHNTQQDYRHLTQLQRLGRVLDDNSRRGDIIARYYRPTSGSLRTKRSREALRASIFAKRQEFGLSQSQQIICRNEDIAMLPQFNGGRRISESGSERSDFYVPTQNDRWIP
jgi:hypothetical protein